MLKRQDQEDTESRVDPPVTSVIGNDRAKNRQSIPWFRDRILRFSILSILVLDQATKYIVKTNLDLYESWPREGLFRVTYGTNSGTAFGLFPNQTTVLIITSLLAIGFIYYFYKSHFLPGRILRLAIGLQLGGAFGNLLDRIRLGSVIDFIDIGWWPIFNIADSSIVTGIGLLILVVLFKLDDADQETSSKKES